MTKRARTPIWPKRANSRRAEKAAASFGESASFWKAPQILILKNCGQGHRTPTSPAAANFVEGDSSQDESFGCAAVRVAGLSLTLTQVGP